MYIYIYVSSYFFVLYKIDVHIPVVIKCKVDIIYITRIVTRPEVIGI